MAPVPEPEVKQLSSDCAELCQVTATGDSGNPMVAKIEASCGCSSHVQDSIKLEAFRAKRISNSNAAADSVVEFCKAKKPCNLELLLDGTNFEITKLEGKEKEQGQRRHQPLGDSLYQGCLKGKCISEIWLKGGKLRKFEARECENLAPEKEPSLKQLSSDCAELCQVTATGDSGNPMVAKIEASCGCQAHVQDSIKLEAFRAERIANSNAAADSVVEFCKAYEIYETCKVQLSLDGSKFGVTGITKLDEKEQGKTESSSSAKKSGALKRSKKLKFRSR